MAELFRITKPDGHLLWTIREDLREHESAYSLLDDNLTALEKEGKCLIKRGGEKFKDPRSGLEASFYLVQRTLAPTEEDFEPKGVPDDATLPEMLTDAVIHSPGFCETKQFYDEFGGGDSDALSRQVRQYIFPNHLTTKTTSLMLHSNRRNPTWRS